MVSRRGAPGHFQGAKSEKILLRRFRREAPKTAFVVSLKKRGKDFPARSAGVFENSWKFMKFLDFLRILVNSRNCMKITEHFQKFSENS